MLGMIKNSLFGSVETWPWQVLSKGSKGDVFYEERACEGGKFATVEVTDKPVDEALREAMPKVMKYVGGSNDKGLGMGMTVPISFAVFPSDDGDLQKKLKVWFRIPNKFQSDPPAPSDDSIKIEDREGITVYSTRQILHHCATWKAQINAFACCQIDLDVENILPTPAEAGHLH
uniref:Heme-binding protein 1 n=1 Tax=Bos indicus x Bos taurus TaxID=30522 RepID=A0A4W2HJ17_BOBOX